MKKIFTNKEKMTPEQYLKAMLESINDDGELYIAKYEDENGLVSGTAVDLSGTTYIEKFEMHCTEKNYGEIIARGNTLVEALQKIAEKNGSKTTSIEEAKNIFDKKLADVWNTYVRHFDYQSENADKIGNMIKTDAYILYEQGCGEFSAEEKSMIENYEEKMREEYSYRIGGLFGYSVVNRAMRLEKLFELGAPSFIIDNEKRNLFEYMALNAFAHSFEIIERENFIQMQNDAIR